MVFFSHTVLKSFQAVYGTHQHVKVNMVIVSGFSSIVHLMTGRTKTTVATVLAMTSCPAFLEASWANLMFKKKKSNFPKFIRMKEKNSHHPT